MERFRNRKIAVIGAGVIGGAITEALLPYCTVTATRRKVDRLERLRQKGAEITPNNLSAAEKADLVILAVKPGQVIPVLRNIAPACAGKLVVSFAAAVTLELMKKATSEARLMRAMTNTAVLVRRGYTVFCRDDRTTEEDMTLARAAFACLGECEQVDEQFLDVLTAMSGSGPAYIYTVVESMINGALRVGLPRDIALRAAAHTAIGASQLLLASGKHPAELRDQVTTPGGVTIEGLYELEESRIRTAFMKAVAAASSRAKDIAAEVRSAAEREIERGGNHAENQAGNMPSVK
ncbi:pyrroline-5-carboxylate reductase [Aminiphilus circumscriptus]|uniref:pyrroline-5-carboxylate reductase n=1 Tax=Aminiphilus circumscriptus TaxID=290732 RepID=UPI000478555A|nr:pyrroline-5-carboxylate reductase [Aminiphilus circumscriptus]